MKLLICFAVLLTSQASASYKVAVFDIKSAIHSTTDGKAAISRLMKEFKLSEAKLKKREYGLQEKIKEFDKKALILSGKKRREQQQELQKVSLNLQRDMQKFQLSFQKKQLEATKPIIEKLKKKVAEIAKKNQYDLILNKSIENVLWAKDSIDITPTVVLLYEKS